tara:strand:+ start:1091 stop:1561 length:471 start_codon:yes stop_codon:yes gene_type:complete
MNQINIFTNSLFFTDQKDIEFKEQVNKTKTVDKIKFKKIIKKFVDNLTKNYNISSDIVSIDNIQYVEDLKNETNLKIVKENVLFQGLYMLDVAEDCGLIYFEKEAEILATHTDFINKFNFITRENTIVSIPYSIDFTMEKNNSDQKRKYIYFTLNL